MTTVESHNVDGADIEAILTEARYGPVTCSFCHKPVEQVAGHVLCVEQNPSTKRIDKVLATCGACNDVLGDFQQALAMALMGHIREMDAPSNLPWSI